MIKKELKHKRRWYDRSNKCTCVICGNPVDVKEKYNVITLRRQLRFYHCECAEKYDLRNL